MDTPDYPAALRERWYLLVVGAVIGVLVAAAVSLALPRGYEASATLFLRVDSAQSSLVERSQFALARIKSYPDLVTSPRVLRATISELDLDLTTGQLADRITATNPRDSVLLTVTATAGSPDEASDIANSVAENIADLVDDLENTAPRIDDAETAPDSVRLELTLPAAVPSTPSSPQTTIILGLGLVTGLALGAIAIAIVAHLDPRIRSPRQVRDLVGLPVAGQLPRRLDGSVRRGSTDARVDEAVRSAIVDLRLLTGTASPEVIVLFAAAPSARRRAHAAQHALARTLTASGRSVESIVTPLPPQGAMRRLLDALADRIARWVHRDAPPAPQVASHPIEAETDAARRDAVLRAVAAGSASAETVLVAGDAADLFSLRDIDQVKVVVVVDHRRSSRHDLVDAVTSIEFAGTRPTAVLMTGVPRRARTDLPATWLETDRVEHGPAAVTAELPRVVRRRTRRKPRATAVSLPGLELDPGDAPPIADAAPPAEADAPPAEAASVGDDAVPASDVETLDEAREVEAERV